MKKFAKTILEPVILVGVHEAKPNKLFSESQRALIRFLRYSRPVPCAECGRKSKSHWSMLCSFEATSMSPFVPIPGKMVHLPLAPVCTAHPLAPKGQ
jgi:hypothetical protein